MNVKRTFHCQTYLYMVHQSNEKMKYPPIGTLVTIHVRIGHGNQQPASVHSFEFVREVKISYSNQTGEAACLMGNSLTK